MKNKKLACLDANIILEILLKRENHEKCKQIINSEEYIVAISFLSIHLIYYFGAKYNLKHLQIEEIIESLNLIDINSETYYLARILNRDKDIEDSLQISSALLNDYDIFITLDKNLIEKYKDVIEILSPQ